MLTYYDFYDEKEVNLAINSCLRPLCSIDGEILSLPLLNLSAI